MRTRRYLLYLFCYLASLTGINATLIFLCALSIRPSSITERSQHILSLSVILTAFFGFLAWRNSVGLKRNKRKRKTKSKNPALAKKAETLTPPKNDFDWGRYVPHGVTYDRTTDSYRFSTEFLLNEGQFILPHETDEDA